MVTFSALVLTVLPLEVIASRESLPAAVPVIHNEEFDSERRAA
jgi:hypothetical protein